MKILYGTKNPAKLNSMKRALQSLDIEIIGLNDIKQELPKITEAGSTPLENARIKALAYYKALHMPVFSCDSGLFFDSFPDELQPGVHVRTINGKALSDDEVIKYYSQLAKKYGDITARYRNAICVIIDENHIYESMEDDLSGEAFIITSKPHIKREKGFPLDCLSIHIPTGKYYYDIENYQVDEVSAGFNRFFSNILQNK